MTRNLTLNLGLRYEYFGQSVNELHDLSVKQQTGSHPFWDTTLPLSATTFPYINPIIEMSSRASDWPTHPVPPRKWLCMRDSPSMSIPRFTTSSSTPPRALRS